MAMSYGISAHTAKNNGLLNQYSGRFLVILNFDLSFIFIHVVIAFMTLFSEDHPLYKMGPLTGGAGATTAEGPGQ